MIQKRYCTLPAAEICRINGWQVGDTLVGRREDDHTRIIVVTAIGETMVLARRLGTALESVWCFAWADWQKIN